jgi:hypothetical protein
MPNKEGGMNYDPKPIFDFIGNVLISSGIFVAGNNAWINDWRPAAVAMWIVSVVLHAILMFYAGNKIEGFLKIPLTNNETLRRRALRVFVDLVTMLILLAFIILFWTSIYLFIRFAK